MKAFVFGVESVELCVKRKARWHGGAELILKHSVQQDHMPCSSQRQPTQAKHGA